MRIVGRASFMSIDRFHRNGRRLLERKRESKGRTSGNAFRPCLSAVQSNDGPTDRKPKANSSSRALDRTATEFEEYTFDVGFGDAAAVVFDRYQNFAGATLRTQQDH